MSADPWAEPIRGLVLDVDDTLLDTRAAMSAAGLAAAAARCSWPKCASSRSGCAVLKATTSATERGPLPRRAAR